MSLNTFSKEKPEIVYEKCKQDVITRFTALNQQTGETGTCKKMLPLAIIDWPAMCVVSCKTTSPSAQSLIFKERLCLSHLAEHGYPVVDVFGDAFIVEQTIHGARFAMLERHIKGIFIEAKTPAPLKALILACLLEIPAQPQQEIWLAQNLAQLKNDIAAKLNVEKCFGLCQERAKTLGTQFKALIQRLENREEMIVDLQMIISTEGNLVIIDPLDIVNNKTHKSVLKQDVNMEEAKDLKTFLDDSKMWLKSAQSFCEAIVNATHANDILTLLWQQDKPLLLSKGADFKNKSRVNQLRYGALAKTTPPSPSTDSSTLNNNLPKPLL